MADPFDEGKRWKYYELIDYNTLPDSFFIRTKQDEPIREDEMGGHEDGCKPEIIFDEKREEYICTSCGLVIEPDTIFQSEQVVQEEKQAKPIAEIDIICSNSEIIPEHVKNYAFEIYEFAEKKRSLWKAKKINFYDIKIASLWISLRAYQHPIHKTEYCNHSQISKRELNKASWNLYNQLTRNDFRFGKKQLVLTTQNPSIYIPQICSNLNIQEYEPLAAGFIKVFNEVKTQKNLPEYITNIVSSSINSVGFAGAAVYMASCKNKKLDQFYIAQEIGLTEAILRKRIKDLKKIFDYHKTI